MTYWVKQWIVENDVFGSSNGLWQMTYWFKQWIVGNKVFGSSNGLLESDFLARYARREWHKYETF